MKCRLLYLAGQLGPGGSERQLWNLLKAMDRDRYQPAVVVWNYQEDETYVSQIKQLGVPIFPLAPCLFTVKKMAQLRRLVSTLQPEVAHSYSFYTNFAAYWATRGTPSIAVGSVRGDWSEAKKDSGPLLGRLSARWPGKQICNSLAAAKAISSLENHHSPRVYVVRNGLDLQRFHVRPLPKTHKPCIAGIGSLLPYKRWDRVLRAAAELKRRGLNFLVRIVGEGPARSSLEQQVGTLGIGDCVELVGHSEHIPEILAEATFLAHTSDTEGCPNVIMEAMACARAVVATDVGDVSALIEDGQTGYIVAPADERTLVERMAALIAHRDVCERMGEAGSAKANREFGLDHLVRETLWAYRSAGWNG
ncbi:MAG TPA: glycosyltransferase family 4 protein [Candidatus Binatia bacterium]|nr:glycosyltransferase family 4 protein [Candidatus Binatia bacterium]